MAPVSLPALRYETEVAKGGRIELPVPLPEGVRVVVFVIEQDPGEFGDLVAASQSSQDFWDNPEDDEDWNDA